MKFSDPMNPFNMHHHPNAEEIRLCMEGEYMYYVKNDVEAAVQLLKQAIEKATCKYYPRKALLDIYTKSGLKHAAQEMYAVIQSSKTNDVE